MDCEYPGCTKGATHYSTTTLKRYCMAHIYSTLLRASLAGFFVPLLTVRSISPDQREIIAFIENITERTAGDLR